MATTSNPIVSSSPSLFLFFGALIQEPFTVRPLNRLCQPGQNQRRQCSRRLWGCRFPVPEFIELQRHALLRHHAAPDSAVLYRILHRLEILSKPEACIKCDTALQVRNLNTDVPQPLCPFLGPWSASRVFFCDFQDQTEIRENVKIMQSCPIDFSVESGSALFRGLQTQPFSLQICSAF